LTIKNVSEVDLAYDDMEENVLGEFGSRKVCKNMDMVCGKLMNAQTTPDLDI
jgi:hypothetical protein